MRIKYNCYFLLVAALLGWSLSAVGGIDDAFDELDQTDPETGIWNKPEVKREPVQREVVIIREVIKIVPRDIEEPAIISPSLSPIEVLPKRHVKTEIGSGISFEFDVCRKRGNEAECYFNVTSQYFDRSIGLGGANIDLYDDVGNKYRQYKVQIGDRETTDFMHQFDILLMADKELKGVFFFKNISSQAKSVSKIKISSAANKSGNWEKFSIMFRELDFVEE